MLFWFFLAGSLKITALLSFFTIGSIFFLEWTGLLKSNNKKIFKHPKTFIIGSIISIGLVFSWILYANHFNNTHSSSYFSTTVFPIWKLNKEGINVILKGIKDNWFSEYYHFSIYALMAFGLIYFFIFFKKINRLSKLSILILTTLSFGYILLQYSLLKDHDYYMTNIFIIPVAFISLILLDIQDKFPKLSNSLIFKAVFSILLITNILYAKNRLEYRYTNPSNLENLANNPYYQITPYLRELGISREDRVISLPGSSHINLVLMDQKGWTQWTDHKLNQAKEYRYNRNEEGIKKSINNGARYLIIDNIEYLYQNTFLQDFTKNLIGKFHEVLIFDLLNTEKTNFNLEKRKVKEIYACDAEHIDKVNNFYSPDSSQLFQNAVTQSAEYSHSGNYSSCLNSDNPYGMTFSIDSVKYRGSLNISVWVKGAANAGNIIISSNASVNFYHKEVISHKVSDSEWFKFEFEFFIPEKLNNLNLKIYLYNPENQNVYFDDLKVINYQRINNPEIYQILSCN